MNQMLDPHELLRMPTVAVVGMGYVGAVSAAGLAQRGCRVIGVESNPTKVSLLRSGDCPVREPGLAGALNAASQRGLFAVTDDLAQAVRKAHVILVAVGTPSGRRGQVDLDAIDRVTAQLKEALAADRRPRIVMIRSTVPPGTTHRRVTPQLKSVSSSVAVCHHPEFLREGSALADWSNPPMIVFGSSDEDRPAVSSLIELLYGDSDAPRLALSTNESELMKYACNLFHAVKIDFANEIGTLANACGADGATVMRALCHDKTLNISAAYLKPGFSFGGSCLPKDTRAMTHTAAANGLVLPLLESVLASNAEHLARQVQRVLRHGRRPTLLVGLSFKCGTDDLRESPMVELAERLLGKGLPLRIFDNDLLPGGLVGANQRYVREHLPHLNLLLHRDLNEALDQAEVVVLTKPIDGFDPDRLAGKIVVDLTRLEAGLACDDSGPVVEVSKRSGVLPGRALPRAA